MTLAIDSQETSNAGHRTVNVSSLTWSFANAAGNLLIVGAIATASAGAPTVAGITYNGVAMSPIGSGVAWDTSKSFAQLFYLINPATGANNVVLSASTAIDAILGGAVSFSGADTTNPIGATSTGAATATGTHATAGSITAAAGNFVVGVGGWGSGTAATADSGQTTTFSLVGASNTGGDDIEALYEASSGAAINLGFTWSPADLWGMVAAEIKAAGGGGGAVATPPALVVPNTAVIQSSVW